MGNIIQAKVDLTNIAAMAYGSGLTEGRSGGEGHIGMIGNRVVKFNTHSSEYSKNSLAELAKKDKELFSQMVESSDVLREKLRGIKDAIKNNGSGNYENLDKIIEEVLDKSNAKWSDDGVLRRKAVAKAVTEINKFLGGTVNEEVWGSVENIKKSLQTRGIGDTRALFTASRSQAGGVQPQVEELKTSGAAALKVGTKRFVSEAVAAAGQKALDDYQRNTKLGRPDFRMTRGSDGKLQMVKKSLEKQGAKVDGYGFDGAKYLGCCVATKDYPKVLLYDRLCAINEGIKAMLKTAHESFPDCGLDQFFEYGDGKVFDDIAKGLNRTSVKVSKEGDCFAVDAKVFGVALQKLQDHFVKVASRQGTDDANGGTKGLAQTAARELSMKIVAFLKRQTGNTEIGPIQTLREVNPNQNVKHHIGTERSHDESKDNSDWNEQMGVKLTDGDTKFWESDIVETRAGKMPELSETLIDSENLSARSLLPNQYPKDLQTSNKELFAAINIPNDVNEYGKKASSSPAPGLDQNVSRAHRDRALDEEYKLALLQKCPGRSKAEAINFALNLFTQTSQTLREAREGNKMYVINAYKDVLKSIKLAVTHDKDIGRKNATQLRNFWNLVKSHIDTDASREAQKSMEASLTEMVVDLERVLQGVDDVYPNSNSYEPKTYAPLEEHKKYLGQLADAIKEVQAKKTVDSQSRVEVMVKWDDASGWNIVAENPPKGENAEKRAEKLRESLQLLAKCVDPVLNFKVQQHLQKVSLDIYADKLQKDGGYTFGAVTVDSYPLDALQKVYDEFKAAGVVS